MMKGHSLNTLYHESSWVIISGVLKFRFIPKEKSDAGNQKSWEEKQMGYTDMLDEVLDLLEVI